MVAGGGSTSTVMTEDGAFTSGSTELRTKQVAVVKCKDCGEILNGERDYHLTQQELDQLEEERLLEERKSAAKWSYIWFIPTIVFGFFLVTAPLVEFKGRWKEISMDDALVGLFSVFIGFILVVGSWLQRPWKVYRGPLPPRL